MTLRDDQTYAHLRVCDTPADVLLLDTEMDFDVKLFDGIGRQVHRYWLRIPMRDGIHVRKCPIIEGAMQFRVEVYLPFPFRAAGLPRVDIVWNRDYELSAETIDSMG